MKKYRANASSDWGHLFTCAAGKASSFKVAFSRAGQRAQTRCRRRPKHMTLSRRFVGTIHTVKDHADYRGFPADEDTPEDPCEITSPQQPPICGVFSFPSRGHNVCYLLRA